MLVELSLRPFPERSEYKFAFQQELRVNNPKTSELKLTKLKPFTSYQIKVLAENTLGRSIPSSIVFATTYEDGTRLAPILMLGLMFQFPPVHLKTLSRLLDWSR